MPSSPVRLVGCDDPGPSDPVRITNISEIAAGMALENVITVSASGGDYRTLEDALNSIIASGPANRYQILIGPGNYTENNPLPTKQYTVITGSSEATTLLEASNPNADMFTSAQFTILENVIISGVSGTGWVYDVTAAHSIQLRGVTFSSCERGVRQNNVNSSIGLKDIRIFSPAIPVTIAGVVCNAGVMEIDRLRVEQLTSVTTVIEADGANADVQVTNSTSQQSGVTTYLSAKNSAQVKMDTMTLANMTDAIVMESGANVRVVASTIVDAGQDALRVNNVGAGPTFSGDGLTVDNPGRYSFNVLHPSAVVSGFGTADLSKINAVPGSQVIAMIVDLTENDEAVNALGEIHGGTAENPSEASFGGGDSTARGMLVWTYNPAGAVWTDVSVAARSASGSTFTFPAIAQDNAVYVAFSLEAADYLQHYGIKASVVTAAVLGGGRIAVEYWNGASWVEINHMSTLADAPYTQHAKDVFERTGSEQVRYPIAFLSSWAKNDPMGLGTNYFWVRYRVATAVTTVPVFQQWKCHTSRFEVNADGTTEYFGDGRYPGDLLVHIVLTSPVVGSAPGSTDVAFASGITLALSRNRFADNSVDAFGITTVIAEGVDTSNPLVLELGWIADTVNGGDVELTADAAQLETGDLWDGSVATTQVAQVDTVGAGTRYVSRLTSFDIDISELVPGETLAIKAQRDATVGNDPPDTLNGAIVFGSVRAKATRWRP